MKSKQIHETVIRDIIDLMADVKNTDFKKFKKKPSYKSLANATSNLILVFPVIVSKNIPIETAGMITKALERKFVSMLQILLSSVSYTDIKDGQDFISQFHTNLKLGDPTIDDFMDLLDTYVKEGTFQVTDKDVYEAIREDMKNINHILPDSLNESSLNSYKICPQSIYGSTRIIKEADDDEEELKKREQERKKEQDRLLKNAQVKASTDKSKTGIEKDLSDIEKNRSSMEKDKSSMQKDKIDMVKIAMDINKNQLLDSDVRKANELIPTSMIVNFVVSNQETKQNVVANMIIGVKAKMYPVDSIDILNRIKLKNTDRHGLVEFIKATTREISFIKDFLFAIDRAKLDAISQSKKGSSSRFWKVLERRGLKSKVRRALGSKNDASAITTLVISQEDVEYLKKTENINVEKPSTIRPIMEAYNLIGFVITNDSMEVSKFIFDSGDDVYENLSYNQLERESSNNEYKKVINLMTKMQR